MAKVGTSEALECFRQYTEAFGSLNAAAVARHFYEPALLITPQGVAGLRTIADVRQAYERIMADLPAQGYERTEFTRLDEQRLDDNHAVITGSGVWHKTTGETYGPFGLMYTLRRTRGIWRIVVAMVFERKEAA
jgi:ketosteroid isomerase-like protein